jgi:hypothetical protein
MAKKTKKKPVGLKMVRRGAAPKAKRIGRPTSSLSKEESFWMVENAMDVLRTRRKEQMLGALLDDLQTEDFLE